MDADARARELLDTYDRDCGRATMYPPRKTLQATIAAALREVEREARREERERCARIAETDCELTSAPPRIAAALRALVDERRAEPQP